MTSSGQNVARATLAFFIVGLLALIAIVGISIWLSERARDYYDQVLVDRSIRIATVELRHAMQTAESSQRGYMLTGNQIYLAPYGNAKATTTIQLETVKRLLAPRTEVRLALERLSTIIAEKVKDMDVTIALQRERRTDEVMAIVRTNRGKALMDEANVFFAGILRATDERLAAGAEEQQANARWLRWLTIIGGAIIVSVAVGAAFTVTQYTREILIARNQVSDLNTNLEQRVKERTAELIELNAELQRFAYVVTHDLRAPLVNIMGFTSELERGVASMRAVLDRSTQAGATDSVITEARTAADEDLPEAIGFIRSSTKKMDTLINAILKLSREGSRNLRPEQIVLQDLVDASADAIQHQLAEAQGSIKIDLAVGTMRTDRLALEQIIGNLLDNAVKYRSNDRPLEISLRVRPAGGTHLTIEVTDNGRGIADNDRERIFELFRRAGAQNQPGDGIGLAHVRAMVRNLGGDIAVESRLGEGTTFRIHLPRELQSDAQATA